MLDINAKPLKNVLTTRCPDPWECFWGTETKIIKIIIYYDEYTKKFWCIKNGKENKTKQKSDNLTPCKTIREAVLGDLMLIWNHKGREVFLLLDKIIRSWNPMISPLNGRIKSSAVYQSTRDRDLTYAQWP